MVKIGRFQNYSSSCECQNGGWQPSCFSYITISGHLLFAGVELLLYVKFCSYPINVSKVIEIFYTIGNALLVPQKYFILINLFPDEGVRKNEIYCNHP